eukprot:TRINITY_DN9428_c0_g2_i6.p1 TRINITY_DN9428_c0_g2~~TRINITY_DN9428_c0_g2_i6.p1  ORF type:complete len:612 (-),score=31.13 TRINITY_DN9428_c0_g2_i6:482-2317(-)
MVVALVKCICFCILVYVVNGWTEVDSSAVRTLLGASDHRYKQGEEVKLYANKIGPYNNPTETYNYYKLPYCQTENLKYKPEDFGEVLIGDRLVDTPYLMEFKVDKDNVNLCTQKLEGKELQKFRDAVKRDFYYQMVYDELPIWGFVGIIDSSGMAPGLGARKQKPKYYLYSHVHFDISFNNDRIIEVKVSTDPNRRVDVSEDVEQPVEVEFSYSVKWQSTDIPFEKRREKYSKYSFLPPHMEIHWFSIINSCVTVVLLVGFLATILMRILKKDIIRFLGDEEYGASSEEEAETGWKYVHGDVFRFPNDIQLFSAFMGTGVQLMVIAFSVFLFAFVGMYYPYNRGEVLASTIVLYAFTAGVAGYVSGAYYKMMGGVYWVKNVLLTASVFCGPVLITFSVLNTVAILQGSTAALPFGTIVIIILLWALITFPLTVLGGIGAKNRPQEFVTPCRTTQYSRPIPPMPWYRQTPMQMVIAGFLPFSAIYIELYYIFASVWGYKIYIIYSILFIVFVLLIVVTAFITIALTYFQLAVEDHRWWWRSFMCGGSTAMFIYLYCFYFYFFKSQMSGFMQTSFYFGYMMIICYGFFLMLGTVGFQASLVFVRYIYKAIKSD